MLEMVGLGLQFGFDSIGFLSCSSDCPTLGPSVGSRLARGGPWQPLSSVSPVSSFPRLARPALVHTADRDGAAWPGPGPQSPVTGAQ